MRIAKVRYLNAKKRIKELQKWKKVVEDWDNAVKDCPFKNHVTAVTIDNGTVKLECVAPTNGREAVTQEGKRETTKEAS